jgi:glucosamine-6-phosphate deaminase
VDVEVLPGEHDVARRGAELAIAALRTRDEPVLLAATGTSPMGLYRELADRTARGVYDTDGLRVAQLDEYIGITRDDPRSLVAWLLRSIAEPLGVSEDRVIPLRNEAGSVDDACREYDRAISDAGGVDLAILGLGPNGHLGFNEPGSTADSPTRAVELTAESLASNARYWESIEVPRRAVTAGMNIILGARTVLLVVLGEHKRAILDRVLHEPIGPLVPASFLRTHPAATVLADEAAMGRL